MFLISTGGILLVKNRIHGFEQITGKRYGAGRCLTTYNLRLSLLGLAPPLVMSTALLVTVFIIDPWMTLMVGILLLLVMLMIAKVVKLRLQRQGIIFQKHAVATKQVADPGNQRDEGD